MEKYSVEQEEDNREKKSGKESKNTCPICGKKLTQNSKNKHCPVHGTEPWEK